jgi:hypothetical protein
MSSFRFAPGQFIIWGVIALGLYAAFQAGNVIAEEGSNTILISTAALIGIIAVLTIRQYWWIPVFVISIFSFSTTLPGFKVDGWDLTAVFGFACLVARLSMGQLHSKNTERNLGIFFYLVFIYVMMHALIFGLENYFSGDTQFKNIAKRYYGDIASLILIWCMDRYASPNGLRITVNLMILITILLSIIAIVVSFLSIEIPFFSSVGINFGWASVASVQGYLRESPLSMMMLALCMTSTASSPKKRLFYLLAIIIFIPAVFFGGGRSPIIMMIVSIFSWMLIKKQWKKLILGCWLLGISLALLFVAGHTIDAKQLQNLPKSFQSIERAVSIFLPADKVNDDDVMTEGSNSWHQDLVKEACEYATENYHSLIFGQGYKGWDDSIDMNTFTFGEAAYRAAVKIAVRMGSSETMLFSTLPILGLFGVLLYYGLMIELLRRNIKVRNMCPEGSLGRSLCEYSFCLILPALLMSPIAGVIPYYNMIGWIIGFIAAEPYLLRGASSLKIKNI